MTAAAITAAITVAGAGPAGLAAAITLARAGRRVVLREWHDNVGHRFHDDFQGLENWSDAHDVLDELAGAGIAVDFECHPVAQGTIFDSRGRAHAVRSDAPIFYMLRRGGDAGTLDRALLAQAQDAGVEVRFGDRVERASGETILATGPRRADVIATGHLFETDHGDGAWLALGGDLAPGGYAYLLIAGGRGTLATCMFRDFPRQHEYLDRTRRFFEDKVGVRMRDARRFGGFGSWRHAASALQGGHPLAGERGGFQDPLAGFGLRYAIRSGVLAARSLLEGLSYDRMWRPALGANLARGSINRALFGQAPAWLVDRAVAGLAGGDARDRLRRLYQPGPVSRLARPVLARLARDPLAGISCGEAGCGCNWCKCGNRTGARDTGSRVPLPASGYATGVTGENLRFDAGFPNESPARNRKYNPGSTQSEQDDRK
jgi:flavin-dependent dehydrogenase